MRYHHVWRSLVSFHLRVHQYSILHLVYEDNWSSVMLLLLLPEKEHVAAHDRRPVIFRGWVGVFQASYAISYWKCVFKNMSDRFYLELPWLSVCMWAARSQVLEGFHWNWENRVGNAFFTYCCVFSTKNELLSWKVYRRIHMSRNKTCSKVEPDIINPYPANMDNMASSYQC